MGVLSEEPAARSRFLEGYFSSTSGVIFRTVHCDSYCDPIFVKNYLKRQARGHRGAGFDI